MLLSDLPLPFDAPGKAPVYSWTLGKLPSQLYDLVLKYLSAEVRCLVCIFIQAPLKIRYFHSFDSMIPSWKTVAHELAVMHALSCSAEEQPVRDQQIEVVGFSCIDSYVPFFSFFSRSSETLNSEL